MFPALAIVALHAGDMSRELVGPREFIDGPLDERRRPAFGLELDHPRDQRGLGGDPADSKARRSEEHTSELQSLMRISYAVFCLKKKIDTLQMVVNTNVEQTNIHAI